MTYPAKTTANFYVWQPTQSQTCTDLGGQNEITETFIVEKIGSTTSNHTEIQFDRGDFKLMVDEVILPDIGAVYGVWNPLATDTKSWHYYARCRGYTISPLPDGRVQIVTQWATQYTADPATVVLGLPEVILPASIESQSGTRAMELYRTNWTTGPLATVDKSASDIGGTATAKGRKGIPTEVPMMKIRVRAVKDATLTDITEAIVFFALNMVGCRHKDAVSSADFLGFPTEALWCEGINIVKMEGEFYEIIADFVFDKYYEHEQVPEFDNAGEPALDNTGTNLADVRWDRIHRDTYDFNEIFYHSLSPLVIDQYQKDFALKGYWT
jgi:hypothetical protein